MQTFLDYLTRKPDESGIPRGFGFHTFFHTAGPLVLILGAALLVLCGFLIAGCFHYRRMVSYRIYLVISLVPLAWGIGIFTCRILEIIDALERNNGAWINGIDALPPLSYVLSEITAVLLACAILTGVFLALSPVLRPRSDQPGGIPTDSEAGQ